MCWEKIVNQGTPLHGFAIFTCAGDHWYLHLSSGGHGSFLYSCKCFLLFFGTPFGVFFLEASFYWASYLFLVKATVHGKHQLLFPVLNFPSCIFFSFVLRVRLHGPGKKNNWQPKWETSSQIDLYLLSFSVYDRERTGWEERLSGKITSNSKSHLDSLTDFLSLSSMLFVCTDQYLE